METIEQIALRVAREMPAGFLWHENCGHEAGIIKEEVIEFARRLMDEVTAQAEPVAYLFQHEDTGLMRCVDAQQVEWGFEANNPRLINCGPLYSRPAQSSEVAQDTETEYWKSLPVEEKLALMTKARDTLANKCAKLEAEQSEVEQDARQWQRLRNVVEAAAAIDEVGADAGCRKRLAEMARAAMTAEENKQCG